MSQYFSRLAQRSGVSDAPASSAQAAAGHGVETWSDTATETIALGEPSAGGNWLPGAEDFAQPAPLNPVPGAAASDGALFLAHVHAVTEAWRGNNVPGDSPMASDVVVPSTDAPTLPAREAADAKPRPSHAGLAPLSTRPMASHATVDQRTPSVAMNTAPEFPPRREHTASDRVRAQSPRPLTATIERPRSAEPTSSVQVHIGRIELEVHAPAATTPMPAPVAEVPVPAAPSRDPGFNRHRHYLRGR